MSIAERIESIKQQKITLKAESEILFTKVSIYSERDELAASFHYEKLKRINTEYLDLDMRLNELLKEVPPPMTEAMYL